MFSNLAQKFTAVKASILPTESDGDTEDDTHICRVLRSYYTEKGRAFPAWLPPDPRAPPPVVIQPPPSQTYGQQGRMGYGGSQGGGPPGGANLSSLFDSQPSQQAGGYGSHDQAQGPTSLRSGRGNTGGGGGAAAPTRQNPFAGRGTHQQQYQQQDSLQVQARPLPSQRAGSQQSVSSAFGGRPDSGSGGVMSAKDKLKMGFGQKRGASPAMSESSQQSQGGYGSNEYQNQTGSSGSRYAAPPQRQQQQSHSGGGAYASDPYGDRGDGGGGYDRGGASNRGGERPFVASNAPWATNEAEFSGGGYDAGYDGGRKQGLPNGPGAGRRGPGLPSGPRGPR